VAVVGSGPAGLAVAIEAARRGLSTAVFERQPEIPDKACGEGIMPAGVTALRHLGVCRHLVAGEHARIEGIRYMDEEGRAAEAPLPGEGGLGIRRTALIAAMTETATREGATLFRGCAVTSHRKDRNQVLLSTPRGMVRAGILVAADGLGSRLRRLEGLERPSPLPRRYGLRRHFRTAPWTSFVEIHFAEDAEAYVTPVAPDRVGVAFLFDERARASADRAAARPRPAFTTMTRFATQGPPTDDRPQWVGLWPLLAGRFPRLMARLEGAEADSKMRGAGPLGRVASSCVGDRFVLVGDAAGYVDAITGEGISLSLLSAAVLGNILPEALARGATRDSLLTYERQFARRFRRYAWLTRGVLAIARRPRLRRSVLALFSGSPGLFRVVLATALDPGTG
jgi:2-polyprenyl-6-methoxyphenol hydroxylase-like FAD-dependent oxidoreductase